MPTQTRVTSLRDYLSALEELGDLVEIDRPVDPHLEVGAICRRSFEEYTPAPLMNNISGYSGFRMLGGIAPYSSLPTARWARLALSLGMPYETRAAAIVERLAEALDADPIAPTVVDSGPCQTHVLTGDAADLGILPAPMLHDGDGGRYLNTIGTVIARTPDGTWTNWHVARCMVIDGRSMNIWSAPIQHFGMIHEQWIERGEPMPVAVAFGPHPAATAVAAMPIPKGVDESGYIGAVLGEPLELVRCKTIDLDVPANSELVIEGLLSVDERTPEGPMGEYHGYLWPETEQHLATQPVCHVTAITYRDDPILPTVPAGKPVDDDHTLVGAGAGAEFLRRLRQAELPATSALLVPETASHLGVVTVSPDWQERSGLASSAELCRRIGEALVTTRNQVPMTRLMVFDDDVDLSDVRDVIWAFTSRCHPTRDQTTIEERRCSPISPAYSGQERETWTGPLVIHDCLLALGAERPYAASFEGVYPEDVRQRVLDAERS